jgi:hypothetical protein
MPRLLGVHFGESLNALAATGAFLTPAVDDLHRFEGSLLLLGNASIRSSCLSPFKPIACHAETSFKAGCDHAATDNTERAFRQIGTFDEYTKGPWALRGALTQRQGW